jgi:lipopolysaccharide transport system ATP-binding protein
VKKKKNFGRLEDIDFKVEAGESVGIIGRNGAGKSTLLKILIRITPPTKGEIILRGRVASLLEVGTGFHPELTGRENVFFNGSILGMKNQEIKRKFDEIVDFSGVESFIDTPFKHYSSGMQMRLAFSVAAHLESEILLIDEVLAVGDAEFQKKCIGKMDDVSKGEGKTILFVSHNLSQISNICTLGLLIASGKIIANSSVENVYKSYVENQKLNKVTHFNNISSKATHIKSCSIISKIQSGSKCIFEVVIQSNQEETVDLSIGIRNLENNPILQLNSENSGTNLNINKGENIFQITVENLNLTPNLYSINLWLGKGYVEIDFHKNCMTFLVSEGSFYPNGLNIIHRGYNNVANTVIKKIS